MKRLCHAFCVITRTGSRCEWCVPTNASRTKTSLSSRYFWNFASTPSNLSCGNGLLTLPHQTRFSLAAFLTMNLSLAARPVCLPVTTTSEPPAETCASPRRMDSSKRTGLERFQFAFLTRKEPT